jgi:protein TonB
VETVETEPAEEAVEVVEEPPVEETQADVPKPPAETSPPEEIAATDVTAPPKPQRRPEPPRRKAVEAPSSDPSPQPAEAAEPSEQQAAKVEPSTAGAGGKAGTQASRDAGSADASSGGGVPGETTDYMTMLRAWLEKHKEYPRRAQRRRQEGTALLYFVMDRDGRVIDYRLERSSGHELLDREVRAMIERAQPLPKMPEDMQRARLELVVPVQFYLR